MPLVSSGAISINAINVELGVAGTTQRSLNDTNARTLAARASGVISLFDFYGKSSGPTPINTTVNFTQCCDHYASIYYNGSGSFYVASHDPSGGIHTSRSDCGSDVQGDIQRYTFTTTGYTTINGSISMSGRNGSATYTISNWSVNTAYGRYNIGVTDASGGAGGYSFTLTLTIT